jgi:hypothetical protein
MIERLREVGKRGRRRSGLPAVTRRSWLGIALALVLFTRVSVSAPLPTALQAELIVKLAAYDKSLRARAGDPIRIFIVSMAGDDASDLWANQLKTELERTERIIGLLHVESIVRYSGAAALAAACRTQRPGIVVLATAIGADAENIRTALDGVNVLTIVQGADYVRQGVVLGFELVSGKPKLFFNIAQANRQGVVMSADVLKLMTVYR